RAEADAFPSHEHQQIAAGHDQHEHLGEEEIEVGEVARVAGLVAHVANRIDVDQRPDPSHDHHHHDRERIELEGDIGADAATGHPVVDDVDVTLAVRIRG